MYNLAKLLNFRRSVHCPGRLTETNYACLNHIDILIPDVFASHTGVCDQFLK